MNFGKLLAVGKSWINGSAAISYRVDKQFYLPKFETSKNPFKKAPAENAVAPAKKETPVAPQKISTPMPTQKPATGWTNKLNPVSIFRSQPEIKNVPTVQVELSLDTVKVVNNDLTDADVEVVPLKSRSGAADLPPPKKSWEILGERLLKSAAL